MCKSYFWLPWTELLICAKFLPHTSHLIYYQFSSVQSLSRVRLLVTPWIAACQALAPHSNTLAWKIPWMEEPSRLQSMGLQSWTRLSDLTFTFHFHALEKEMATYSSVLAWRIPGTGEPGGLPSMGSHRVGHEWSDLAAAAAAGLPVHHQLPESTQTHVHRVSDAIQPSHPLSSPSPPTLNLSQHQGLFKWVSSSHQMAKVLEFQFQHQSFQWTAKTDLL